MLPSGRGKGSKMAKVVRIHEFGGPDVLRLDDVEVGEPGPGEVRIRVGAIGLNRVEAQYRAGNYSRPVLPSRIGFEAAGVIEAVGPAISGLTPGERVVTLAGVPMDRYGTYGEVILFPANMLASVPAEQSLIEAAACWTQYFTAYALVDVGHVGPGDHVVITAASSSVGLAAIQIANGHGAIPIAVTRGRGKRDALRQAGAAHVIVSEEEDLATRLAELTGGKGARIAFDAVGGTTLSTLAASAAPCGVLIYYGVLAGLPADFPWMALLGNNLTVRGFAANLLSEDREAADRVIGYVNAHLASGAFRPVIDRIFPLEQIADAHRYLESNVQLGKIVVTTATSDE